ncbi:hypothetical protein DM02DRAFT_546652 [Periconia macrospinosa]|uniref:Amino acid transporter transmembrane domain-containing protein n=1 Tax=Periconia macrospinosa TaxID=97972 RepID=A0A2V1CZ35_9PLEO|nr:hypothetical protein DM02DRAFT_546652 [Periconia macrospinosa]
MKDGGDGIFQPWDPESNDADVVSHNEGKGEVEYKTCEWWHTGIIMIAEIISLGVLAMPQALASLGLLPGIMLIIGLSITTTYTGYLIGQFKLAYPAMQSFADCGELIAGPIGREVMAFCQVLILLFIMAAHVLSFGIAMNVMTEHGQCTVVFTTIGMVLSFILCLPRTLKNVSYVSIISCLSILVAVIISMIAIAIRKEDMGNVVAIQSNVSLLKGLGPVMNIVLAYAGHVTFFSLTSELRDPRDFTKSLLLMQSFAVSFYLVMSITIYYYAGPNVASPALGSAPPLVAKIAYGIALPTIVVAGVINGSVACKYVYFRMWAGTDVIYKKSLKSVGSWTVVCAVAWVLAWAVAEAIPNFNLLLGLIASMFGSWYSYTLPPVLFLYQYRGHWFDSKKRSALTVLNITISMLGLTICIMGMWSSIVELSRGGGGRPFTCAG